MESAHRKIRLQSPEDFSFLIANVRRAAAASIDAAFPPVDSDEDELRASIEQLVEDYIVRTFTLAAPNLTINGLPVDARAFLSGDSASAVAHAEQYEAFDARRCMRFAELVGEEENLMSAIARLKRKVPAATAAAWAETARRADAADEEALARGVERARTIATATPAKILAYEDEDKNGFLVRQTDVEATFGTAVETLGRLKTEMPGVVAKMERARVAGAYAVAER